MVHSVYRVFSLESSVVKKRNKLDKLYKSPLTLWTSAISRVTKQASGKCVMHNLADLNLNLHALLARLV